LYNSSLKNKDLRR